MEKCILFGGGGREAIIAQKLSGGFELYSYMSHKNPTIIKFVEQTGGKFVIDKDYNKTKIEDFIKSNNIKWCVTSNDGLQEMGMVDIAKNLGLFCFGGTKDGSRVEWDKAFTTRMIERIAPQILVKTTIVDSLDTLKKAIDESAGIEFVVKPNYLTGGKGVKVGGDHFMTKQEGYLYAKDCFAQGGVIIQDKMIGKEFTLMGFTNGKDLVLAPCTYDYPYRFANDTGPGTGGMGSVCFENGLLPFLTKDDIAYCKKIMQEALHEINKDGLIFNGVLYGAFFKTTAGIKFIEFNSRLGDPEVFCVLGVLKTPFYELVKTIAQNKPLNEHNCQFEKTNCYAVCVCTKAYAVDAKAEPIAFNLPTQVTNPTGAEFYASAMEQIDGNSYKSVGNSRLFVLVKKGSDMMPIKKHCDDILKQHVNKSQGLDWRGDIGVTGINEIY